MKRIFLLVAFAPVCLFANAQNVIAVEHNGVSTFYASLDSAVNAAQTGDNVYVPGGNFILNVPISKGFNLIGAGYNPDSTAATGATQITSPNNNIYVVTGADNGSIEGILFSNMFVSFGTSPANENVYNFSIKRCRLLGLALSQDGTPSSQNLVFTENIFDNYVEGNNVKNCIFKNNFFGYAIYNISNSEFDNNTCIYNGSGNWQLYNINNSTFKNNIFLHPTGYFSYNSSNNIFYNNLFTDNFSGILPGTDANSIYSISQSSIFVNQSGSTYDFHQNYHLQSSCPGKNYGTDGTDVGVYGTISPWKEGGVPFNPHIQLQQIANQTDGNGNLNVNIKVAAQKN